MSSETIEYRFVRLEFDGPLAVVTLNDPAALNAISEDMALEVAICLNEVNKPRRGCRALLLTGEGRAFSAGVNLMGKRTQVIHGTGRIEPISGLESCFLPVLRRLNGLAIPVVAGVNGLAVGIGVALALAADHVVAAESAWFQTPFRNLASAPDSGLTWLLPQLIGVQRGKRMLMRGERVDARTALDWGLISEVAGDDRFGEAARAVAMEYAHGPTVALREIKRLIADGLRSDLHSAYGAEVAAVERTARTRDNVAAVKLFATKSVPTFIGE